MPLSGGVEMFRLDGRTALVTGAASGIGAAVAQSFAEAGANVVACWYGGDPDDVNVTAARVRDIGRSCLTVEGNVSSEEAVRAMFARAEEELGPIDIVVANAGITRRVPVLELSDEAWHEILDVNLLGVVHCFRAALPGMTGRGWGRLLATGSISVSVRGWKDHAHYTAAKAGVAGFARTLALEVARQGVTVNVVAPGVIKTPVTSDPMNSLGPVGLRDCVQSIPMLRVGTPLDVAPAFVYLASEEAGWITGQTLLVDGGSSIAYV